MTALNLARAAFIGISVTASAFAIAGQVMGTASPSSSNPSVTNQSGATVVCGRSKFKKPLRTGSRRCVEFGAPTPSGTK